MFRLIGGFTGLIVALVLAQASNSTITPPKTSSEQLIQLLDQDGDGQLAPYEGADAIIQLLKAADKDRNSRVTAEELALEFKTIATEHQEELAAMFVEIDADQSGNITIHSEVPLQFRINATRADANKDGKLSKEEFLTISMIARHEPTEPTEPTEDTEDFEDPKSAAADFLEHFDKNSDHQLTLDELPDDLRAEEQLKFLDPDGNKVITVKELETMFELEFVTESPASFTVDGTRCIMNGVIGPSTPSRLLELLCEHPQVRVIEMHSVPGSMDDVSNLRAARLLRRHGLSTHLPKDAMIASGGVDFFLAGLERIIDKGARLGVHSWGEGDTAGGDLPREHEAHSMFTDFYTAIEIPVAFYWFTLKAARPEGIHWMTETEITRYKVATPKPSKSKTPTKPSATSG